MMKELIINFIKKMKRRQAIIAILVLLLLPAGIAGYTGSWFTNEDQTPVNRFTAGTVIVEAGGSQGELIIKDITEECKEVELEITNTGTKYSYVRAQFAGSWRAALHSNTASVTAEYTIAGVKNSITSNDDSAHFIDGSYTGEPLISLPGTISPGSWFTASDSTEQLLISPHFPVYTESNGSTSSSLDSGFTLTSAALLTSLDKSAFEVQQLSASSSSGPPTVNGLFYGDGDYQKYIPIGVSERGSTLYYYLYGNVLYVAMVVDSSVNDNVFDVKGQGNNNTSLYMESAGWGQHREFKRLADSENMGFTLSINCAGSETSWSWYQPYVDELKYKDEQNKEFDYAATNWSSGSEIGDSLPVEFEYTSSSSLVWNLNNSPWANNGQIVVDGGWKSPFTETEPPEIGENDVNLVAGYPDYSSGFSWEWAMVYEFSVDLSSELNCADYTISLSGGNAHHSPAKTDGQDEPVETYDWGDLPDGPYPTLAANNGPRHEIVIGGAYLGNIPPDAEPDGQPTLDARGDDDNGIDDEDGIKLITSLIPGHQAQFQVIAGTPGYLSAWIDFNESGTLTQINLVSITGPSGVNVIPDILGDYHLPAPGDYIITVEVPTNANGTVFSRWRYTNQSGQGGNSITGEAATGEVEDHAFDITNDYPGIELKKYVSVDDGDTYFDADTMPGPALTGNDKPIFKFVVTNTGTVNLEIDSIVDNKFQTVYPRATDNPIIISPGESEAFYYPNRTGDWGAEEWKNYLDVRTGGVDVDLCDDESKIGINDDWVKHTDGYFYYKEALEPGETVTLCIKVCPQGVPEDWKDFVFINLKGYVEAVQASNDAVYKVWFSDISEGVTYPIIFTPKPE